MKERGADEERIHCPADGADEAAYGVLSIGQESDRDVVQGQLVRDRIGNERRHAGRDFDQPAGAFRREIGRTHVILGSAGIGGVILGFESNLK